MAGAGVVHHRCGRDWRPPAFILLALPFSRCRMWRIPRIPSASAWAQKRQIELPFSDFESLRQAVIDALGEEANYLRNVANFAKATTTNLVFSVLGIIAAASLFFKTGLDPHRGTHRVKNNLYSICCDEVSTRFRDFYRSFATVMGAQITISLINTVLTAIFLSPFTCRTRRCSLRSLFFAASCRSSATS